LHEAWSGVLTITGTTGLQRRLSVGPDGAYAVTLPVGRYEIVGRSPHFNGCDDLCRAPRSQRRPVIAGRTTTLNTYCPMS
jgi:hypothetical protein